jgi:hypothetical protein
MTQNPVNAVVRTDRDRSKLTQTPSLERAVLNQSSAAPEQL